MRYVPFAWMKSVLADLGTLYRRTCDQYGILTDKVVDMSSVPFKAG